MDIVNQDCKMKNVFAEKKRLPQSSRGSTPKVAYKTIRGTVQYVVSVYICVLVCLVLFPSDPFTQVGMYILKFRLKAQLVPF